MKSVISFSYFIAAIYAQWVWLKGSSGATNDNGDFGIIGVPSVSDTPNSVTNINGIQVGELFYFFGGYTVNEEFDNLWRFNMSDDTWVLVSGSVVGLQEAVYGTRSEFDDLVKPGYRRNPYLGYDERSDSLIVFGGYVSASNSFYSSTMEYSFSRDQWRWVRGNQTRNGNSVFGDRGVEDPSYVPGARSHGQFFTDNDSGCFYIYGGFDNAGSIAELWRFNYTSQSWAFISGTAQRDSAPTYTLPGLFPGSLAAAAYAYDHKTKKFYLFGGWDGVTFSLFNIMTVNDLWEYDLKSNTWTRLSGSNARNSLGVYGPIGEPSRAYTPRSRSFAYMSIDHVDKALYMFGGQINNARIAFLNDFWRYNISSGEWTLLGGAAAPNNAGTYGQRGVTASTNYPPARSDGASFFSSVSKKFYVFGGLNSIVPLRMFADTWMWSTPPPEVEVVSGTVNSTTRTATRRIVSSISQSEVFPLTGLLAIAGAFGVLALVVALALYSRRARLLQLHSKSKFYATENMGDGYNYPKSKGIDPFANDSFNNSTVSGNQSNFTGMQQSMAGHGAAYRTQTLFAEFEGLAIPAHLTVQQTDFRLAKKIARGGGGTVYLAEPTSQVLRGNPIFVAKIVDLNEMISMQHFHQEISIMHVLKDVKNIAKLIGYCEEPLAMLMKFYAEGNLLEFSKNLKTRPKLRFLLIKDVSCALAEMHTRDLVHCDIKPENVLIDFMDGRPTAVLTDFGITQVLNDQLLQVKAFTVVNIRGVSIGYAAPEVFQRLRLKFVAPAEITKAGDVYAFSCVIYFLLMRRVAWK